MRRASPAAIAGAALVLAGAVLFHRALFLDENFVERDLAVYYRPAKALLVRLSLESGGLPLWNPYFASGQPYAANPGHDVFHPMTVLFFVLPFEWAFRLQLILPLLVAAASMFLLLRSLGRSGFGAGFGALAWGLGGYTLSTTNGLPILFAVSVIPALMAFTVRAAIHGRRRDVVGLACAAGLTGLAGEPVALLTTPLLLVPVLVSILARGPGAGVAARRLAPGLLTGLGLSAATLLPALRLAADSVRALGIPPEKADLWSFPPLRLVELFVPFAMGHPGVDGSGYWGLGLYPDRATPFLYSVYPGLLVSLLALLTLASAAVSPGRKRSRLLLTWGATAFVGTLLAIGSHAPLWPLVRAFAPFSAVRYPEKFMLAVALPVTVLGATGFDWMLRPGRRLGARARTLLVLASAAAGAGALAVHLRGRDVGPASWRVVEQDLLALALLALAYRLGVSTLARLGRRAGYGVLLAVAALDLSLVARGLLATRPVSFLRTPPPVIRSLLDAPLQGVVFHGAAWRVTRAGFAAALPPLPAFWGLPLTLEPDYDSSQLRWSGQASAAFRAVLTRDAATGIAVLRRRGVGAVLRLAAGSGDDGSRVEAQRLPDPRPFAFLARWAGRLSSDHEWTEAVLRLGPVAAETVLLNGPAEAVPLEPSGGTVTILERRPGQVVLIVDVAGPAPGVLAINQTWDRYWKARIDGAESALLRAELDLSGLVVRPGRHRVELSYDDPWLRAGLGVSGVALLALLALLVA